MTKMDWLNATSLVLQTLLSLSLNQGKTLLHKQELFGGKYFPENLIFRPLSL